MSKEIKPDEEYLALARFIMGQTQGGSKMETLTKEEWVEELEMEWPPVPGQELGTDRISFVFSVYTVVAVTDTTVEVVRN